MTSDIRRNSEYVNPYTDVRNACADDTQFPKEVIDLALTIIDKHVRNGTMAALRSYLQCYYGKIVRPIKSPKSAFLVELVCRSEWFVQGFDVMTNKITNKKKFLQSWKIKH